MAQLLAEVQLQAFQRPQQGLHAAHIPPQPCPVPCPLPPAPAPGSAGPGQHLGSQPGGACGRAQSLSPDPAAAADHEQRIAQIEARLGGLLAGGRQPLAPLPNPANTLCRSLDAGGHPESDPAGACERPAPAKPAVRGRGARAPVRHEATTQTEQDGRHLDRLQVRAEVGRYLGLVTACQGPSTCTMTDHKAIQAESLCGHE